MGRMRLDKVDYVNIAFFFLLSPSFPLLAPHPTPSSYDLDFASVITPDLTLRRSDTDWTWTLHLSSRWSTRLCVIDLIFLGSRNNSTSCFLLLPWLHLALLLSQERLHSHWSWPTCFPLWPAHQPQYVIIFYYHFSSDSFIFLQLSVELFLVAISHPSYILTTSCLTIIPRTSTFAPTCFTRSRALPVTISHPSFFWPHLTLPLSQERLMSTTCFLLWPHLALP